MCINNDRFGYGKSHDSMLTRGVLHCGTKTLIMSVKTIDHEMLTSDICEFNKLPSWFGNQLQVSKHS